MCADLRGGQQFLKMSINLSMVADIEPKFSQSFLLKQLKQMNDFQAYIAYNLLIENWHTSLQEGKRPGDYVSSFKKKIKEILFGNITFDRRIVDCLFFNILHSHSNTLNTNHLLNISQQLHKIHFISYKDSIEIQHLAGSTIINKAGGFIEQIKELEILDPDKIEDEDVVDQLWQKVMKLTMPGFWKLILVKQMKYPLLIQLYDITSVCHKVRNIERLKQRICSLHQDYESVQYEERELKPKLKQSSRSLEKFMIDQLRVNPFEEEQKIVSDSIYLEQYQQEFEKKPYKLPLVDKIQSRKESRSIFRQNQKEWPGFKGGAQDVPLIDKIKSKEESRANFNQSKQQWPIFKGLAQDIPLIDKIQPKKQSLPQFHYYKEEKQQMFKAEKKAEDLQFQKVVANSQDQRKSLAIKPVQQPVRQPVQIFPSVSKEQKPYFLFKEYTLLPQRSNNQVQRSLITIAYQNSLFFHPNFKKLINNTQSFFVCMKSIASEAGLQLALFGSIRSRLALKNDFDVDLTFIGNIPRGQGLEVLDNFKTILINTLELNWIKQGYILSKITTLPPLLQIKTNPKFKQIFQIQLDKIDITACNDTAAINSEFLSHYARIPQVCLFCLLVKFWAKNTNVINRYKPMDGLSSYGIILMCLYFLMQTEQINFLQYSQQQLNNITVGSLIPNTRNVKCRPIDRNFLDFLDFYREGGRFHRQSKIICLLKNGHRGCQFRVESCIFNMYDFIDNTNPSRVTYQHRAAILGQFQRAYRVVRDRDLRLISQILTEHRPVLDARK